MVQDDLIQVDMMYNGEMYSYAMYNDGKYNGEMYNDAMHRVVTVLLLGKFIFIPFFNIHTDVIFYAQ